MFEGKGRYWYSVRKMRVDQLTSIAFDSQTKLGVETTREYIIYLEISEF